MTAASEGHRVLFVDDAVELLDGLRNGLRRDRRAWRMRFADGGAAALRLLEEEPADVVVTDMRMPGIDGLELLRQVRSRWPDTMRVILSGQADLATVIQASAVAHQYLAKPCDLMVLREVVHHGFRTLNRLRTPELRRALGSLGSLPACPGVVRDLGAALARDKVDLHALASLAETDAGVTARLLQFANSPYCGLARKVLAVEPALVCLGPATTRQLLGTLEPLAGPEGTPPAHAATARHALVTARLTRRIAPGHPAGAVAYAAALLHQAGDLVLMTRMRDRWEEIHRIAAESNRAREDVERELLGADHARLGSYLLGLWGVPDEVVDVVDRLHERPDESGEASPALALVRSCDRLAREATGGTGAPSPEGEAALARAAGNRLDDWRRMAAEESATLGGPTRASA